jgi:hypothetical protein
MAPLGLIAPAVLMASLSPLSYIILSLINYVALNTMAANAISPTSNQD